MLASFSAAADAPPPGRGIGYHGGRVLSGAINVYPIFYGKWTSGSYPANLEMAFLQDLPNVAAFRTVHSYYDSNLNRANDSPTIKAAYYDNYSVGSNFNSACSGYKTILDVINHDINSRDVPYDANGVYYVYFSKDLTNNISLGGSTCGFPNLCVTYKGIHGYSGFAGLTSAGIPYGYQGECAGLAEPTVALHELAEITTDPFADGWYTDGGSGLEMGDKCVDNGTTTSWTYNSSTYQLQQLWANDGDSGYCASQWPYQQATGNFEIASQNDSRCIDIPTADYTGYGTDDGLQGRVWDCLGFSQQVFSVAKRDDGYYTLSANISSKPLYAGSNSHSDGAAILQETSQGASDEEWYISPPDSSGYSIITSVSSGRVITVYSTDQGFGQCGDYTQTLADGCLLVQWNYFHGNNQKWRFSTP